MTASDPSIDSLEPRVYTRDEHPITRAQIDPDVLKIMQRLARFGFKGHLVGGGVRDLLLGKTPKDFDIATDATPRDIKDLFRNSRIIGRRFKLVHIFFRGNKTVEVATFRDNSTEPPNEGDGEGEPEDMLITRDNVFGTEATDAYRRDLTINGLFYDANTSSILDYVGGMEDLRQGIVRIIGDPDLRFAEDPVRLIRVVRHAVRSGFRIDGQTWAAVLRNAHLLQQSSQVRVYEELRKDLLSGCALPILRRLGEAGLLAHIFPHLDTFAPRILEPRESPLVASLERADLLAYDHLLESTTPVLAAFAYWLLWCEEHSSAELGTKSAADVPIALADRDGAMSEVKRVFDKLSVPRREREKISEILFQLARLRTSKSRGGAITQSIEFIQSCEVITGETTPPKLPTDQLEPDLEFGLDSGPERNGDEPRRRRRRGRRGRGGGGGGDRRPPRPFI